MKIFELEKGKTYAIKIDSDLSPANRLKIIQSLEKLGDELGCRFIVFNPKIDIQVEQ